MKNVSLVVNGILAIAVIILFVLHFSTASNVGSNDKTDLTESISQTPEGDVKVAYVLIDSLLTHYKLAQNLSADLLKTKQGLESELATKGQKLEKKISEYQYQVQRGLITSWDAQEKEKQLGEEQQVFVNLQNDMQNRLFLDEQEKNAEVYEAVIDYIDRYNATKGYSLIFSQTSGGVLLYAEKYMNITGEVLAGINAEYEARK